MIARFADCWTEVSRQISKKNKALNLLVHIEYLHPHIRIEDSGLQL